MILPDTSEGEKRPFHFGNTTFYPSSAPRTNARTTIIIPTAGMARGTTTLKTIVIGDRTIAVILQIPIEALRAPSRPHR